jgi:hypothetical protein
MATAYNHLDSPIHRSVYYSLPMTSGWALHQVQTLVLWASSSIRQAWVTVSIITYCPVPTWRATARPYPSSIMSYTWLVSDSTVSEHYSTKAQHLVASDQHWLHDDYHDTISCTSTGRETVLPQRSVVYRNWSAIHCARPEVISIPSLLDTVPAPAKNFSAKRSIAVVVRQQGTSSAWREAVY